MGRTRWAWLLPCLLMLAAPASAADTSSDIEAIKQQIKLLMQRVEELEKRQQAEQAASEAAQPEAAAVPSAAPAERSTAAVDQEAVPAPSTPGVTTAENTGNPSISVIGTFAGSMLRGGNGVNTSSFLPLSEAEFVFGAAVDPHTRLDVTVTAANGGMSVEEGFLTVQLPAALRLRAGRKFIPLGRANEVHPHALVYADTPNGLVNLFGPEKFIGEGVFLDRPFYLGDSVHQLTVGFFRTSNDVAFDPTGAYRYAGIGRWSGMWDLSDTSTLELGASYVSGRNGIAAGSRSEIFGGHLALKQVGFDHRGWSLEGEWNRSRIHLGVTRSLTDGAYLLGEYDFSRHWLVFGRYDYSRMTGLKVETAYSGGGAWKISEFQSLTLQYKHTRHALAQTAAQLGLAPDSKANELFLRWVVAIGPHPAHPY
ncbi:MAG: hypothetical protein D6703_03705 [Zetaproteobacteria bacterium]|nr:MAG: hypothetical protein D6703_03705 [Zetaproteobacteria bacterium]